MFVIIFILLAYKNLGCWKDKTSPDRAFSHKMSEITNPIGIISECLKLARDNRYTLFALQNGKHCYGGAGDVNYKIHGNSNNCNSEGTGGNWANQVYEIQGRRAITIFIY